MAALEITGLKKTYADGTVSLKGIDLVVEQGDFFALLGANGAGKSTAIGIICSLVNKTAGQVKIFGNDLDTAPASVKQAIGLVPQEFNFNMFEPVEEIVINQAGYYGIPRHLAAERAEFYLRKLDLWDKRRSMARQLSGGMKRRLMIARALVHEPKLLILDEPTAGVDIEIRNQMWNFLKEINDAGTTIILTTHYLEEAEQLCRNIAIIKKGEIFYHCDMLSLLSQLDAETLILQLTEELESVESGGDIELQLLEPKQLQVTIPKGKTINDLFVLLNQQNIQISSLRNKKNRLEQLFMNILSETENNG